MTAALLASVLARLRFLHMPNNGLMNVFQIKCADAFRMLTVAYDEATLDRSNVMNDEERVGRSST